MQFSCSATVSGNFTCHRRHIHLGVPLNDVRRVPYSSLVGSIRPASGAGNFSLDAGNSTYVSQITLPEKAGKAQAFFHILLQKIVFRIFQELTSSRLANWFMTTVKMFTATMPFRKETLRKTPLETQRE